MGGSVNLQGGGQYQTPNIQGYGQGVSNMGRQATGFERGIRDNNPQDYGIPPGYDAAGLGMTYGLGAGNYGGGYDNFGNFGNYGFRQNQPNYEPAPVMQPYVDQVSSGGKGMRSTPAQSVAYAPMNIPQMQLAQPSFYYPNIGSQMANLNNNYGIGGLGAMGAFGNYPMMPRQPAPMQMYPALQPPPPQTSTGGKGFRSNPPMLPPARPPTQPAVPPVSTGGKGFQPNQPLMPDTYPTRPPYLPQAPAPTTGGVPEDDMYLRPVSPDVGRNRFDQYPDEYPQTRINYPETPSLFVPGYTGPMGTLAGPSGDTQYAEAAPYREDTMQYPIGAPMPDIQQEPVEATSPVYEEPSYNSQMDANLPQDFDRRGDRDLID